MCHPAYVDRIIMGSAYCYPRLDELDVLTSASLKAAVATGVIVWEPTATCKPDGGKGK